MNLGLADKRALVTAASSGLGFATARALALEGAAVALCSRDQARADEAAARLRDEGGQAHAFGADVSLDDDLRSLFAAASSALGGLDILVCNAGGPPAGDFRSVDERDWDTAYALTLQSVVRSVRYALPHFAQAGGGRVLVIGSSSVKRPIPNLLLSNVFRPAVQGLCKALAVELADENVQINLLAPGRIETERTQALDEARAQKEGRSFEEVRRRSEASIPMGRLGSVEEFASVAAFLCSDAARYMTGSTVLVDGGAVTCL